MGIKRFPTVFFQLQYKFFFFFVVVGGGETRSNCNVRSFQNFNLSPRNALVCNLH